MKHSNQTTLDLVTHQRSLSFAPGSRMMYSNTPYALLATVVERVTGKPLGEFMEERFFRPLGMRHTSWRTDHRSIVPNRATAYRRAQGGYRADLPFTNIIGNGGLIFTIADALRWNANLERPAVGRAEWRDLLETPGRLTNGSPTNYAIGLQLQRYLQAREIGHDGDTGGYEALVARYPDQALTVVVACNVGGANPKALGRRVARLFLPEPAPPALTPVRTNTPVSEGVMGRWIGIYRADFNDAVIRVNRSGSFLAIGSEEAGMLENDHLLRTPRATLELLSGTHPAIRVIQGTDTTRYDRVAAADTTHSTRVSYEGTFESPELGVRIAMVSGDRSLYLVHRLHGRIPLVPNYRDDFGLGDASFRFIRDSRGWGIGFRLYFAGALNVEFRRVSRATTL